MICLAAFLNSGDDVLFIFSLYEISGNPMVPGKTLAERWKSQKNKENNQEIRKVMVENNVKVAEK